MDIRVLVPLAHGTEEMEAVIIIDMLRRAGIQVKTAGEQEIITCSRGVKILPDALLHNIDETEEFDALVIPGGMPGSENLAENDDLTEIIERHRKKPVLFGAICAAPIVLLRNKLLPDNCRVTSHPSVKNMFGAFDYTEEKVTVYENIITSRGAGTAFDFTLEIISKLVSPEKAREIADAIVLEKL